MNVQPFAPNSTHTKSISATSSGSSATLDATDVSSTPTPASAGLSGGNSVMRIVNAGPNVAFIRWSVGASAAAATDMPMLPNTVELFNKANDVNTVSAITASGQTATIYITCGEGM